MLFAAYKDSFASALDRVSRVVKSNPRSVEILQCIRIDSGSAGVFLTANSPMAKVKVKVDGAKAQGEDSVIVNFDKIKDRVSKTSDTIRVEATNGKMSIVSNKDQKLGLTLGDLAEFPVLSWSVPEESYGIDKEEFLSTLALAGSLTSAVSALTPAFLQVKISKQTMTVASGVTFQKIPLECNPELESTIPTQTLSALQGFVKSSEGDVVWMSQLAEDSDIVITVGDDQFQTVPLALDFPDLEPVFNKIKIMATDELHFSETKRLLAALSKAKTSVDSYGTVNLDVQGTAMTTVVISASNEHGDWFEDKLPVLWSGSASGRKLRFNIDSLISYVKSVPSDSITLRFGEDFRGDLSPAYYEEGSRVGILNQFRI